MCRLEIRFLVLLIGLISFRETFSDSVEKTSTSTSNGRADGSINVNIVKILYEQNSSVTNINSINGRTTQQNLYGGVDTNFVPYFGVEFTPMIVGSSPNPDIKRLLKVVQTRTSSIVTNEMGHSNPRDKGPWDSTPNSRVAKSCAEMNREMGRQVCNLLQGALLHTEGGDQPDLAAAYRGAIAANGISINTVWGIKIGIGWEKGAGYIKDTRTGYQVIEAMKQYKGYVRGHNMKIGAFAGNCGDILGGTGRQMLTDLALTGDFIICGIYSKIYGESDPQNQANDVVSRFGMYNQSFHNINPRLEVILQTGWIGNKGRAQQDFWQEMERWAGEKGVKVYMHEAFDSAWTRGGLGKSGYWSQNRFGQFVESGTGKILKV